MKMNGTHVHVTKEVYPELHSLCTQKLKTGIFECCSKLNFQFFAIHERDKKLKFSNVGQ